MNEDEALADAALHGDVARGADYPLVVRRMLSHGKRYAARKARLRAAGHIVDDMPAEAPLFPLSDLGEGLPEDHEPVPLDEIFR